MTTILLSKAVSPNLFYFKINQPFGKAKLHYSVQLAVINKEIIMITNSQDEKMILERKSNRRLEFC